MSFSFKALGGILASEGSVEITRLQKIGELKQKLVDEGYQPSEAEHFVKLAAGSKKLSDLDNKGLDSVIEQLTVQIKIAQQCKNIIL